MSTPLQPVITQAGLAAIFRATNDGLAAQITHIVLGSTGYTPVQTQTALRSKKGTYPISDGQKLSSTQLHLTAVADDAADYWVREVGFLLSDGTLLAVWSDPTQALAYKSPNAQLLLAYDLSLAALPADSVTITSTGAGLNLTLSEQLAELASAQIATLLREFKQQESVDALTKQDQIIGQQIADLIERMRNTEQRQVGYREDAVTAIAANAAAIISMQTLISRSILGVSV
jgi:hypothetical protein